MYTVDWGLVFDGLTALGTLAAVIVSLVVSFRARRDSRESAAAAARQADEQIAAANAQAREAIEAANRRAENDLYRSTLADLSALIGRGTDRATPDGQQAFLRCQGLLVVLPEELFPLPVTRTFFEEPGYLPSSQSQMVLSADPGHGYERLFAEIREAVARLHQRSVIQRLSAQLSGSGSLTAAGETQLASSVGGNSEDQ